MNVKHEPFDSNERVKTEPSLGLSFKSDPEDVLDESFNIFETQTTGQFAGDVEIEQVMIKCEVPTIEPDAALPLKHDNENVPMLSTIKKEPENINDFHEVGKTDLLLSISNVKREVGEHLHVKTESELLNLNTHCDIPTLKDEDTKCMNYFSQPYSSKPAERQLQPLKNKILKVVCKKRRLYLCPVCQKNFHSSKSRSKHFDRHFSKGCVVCEFCGKCINRIEFLRHYFIHVVQNTTRNVSQKIIEDSKRKRVCINYIGQTSHTKSHINDKSMNCDYNFNFSYSKLKSSEKPYKCGIWSKQFNAKSSLSRHLNIHSHKQPYKCDICLKKFKMKIHLNQHVIIHTNKNPFKCHICFKQFNTKATIYQHLIFHSDEKRFKCEICSVKFRQQSELRTHLLYHTNQKSFKCNICFKGFNQKCTLHRHLITHTNEKPWKCDICSKQFNRKFNLNSHLTIHSHEKPFKCDICSKQFNRASHLRSHLMTHSDEKPFECNICSKKFKRKAELKRHFSSSH